MKRILWVVLGAVLATAGCSDPIPPATPSVVPPTITDTFADTLLVLGANTHSFTVTAVSGLKVNLNSLQPGAAVGLGVGTFGSTGCLIMDRITTVAGQTAQLSGTATVPGLYCVEVFDLGNLVEPVSYNINVLHQ